MRRGEIGTLAPAPAGLWAEPCPVVPSWAPEVSEKQYPGEQTDLTGSFVGRSPRPQYVQIWHIEATSFSKMRGKI